MLSQAGMMPTVRRPQERVDTGVADATSGKPSRQKIPLLVLVVSVFVFLFVQIQDASQWIPKEVMTIQEQTSSNKTVQVFSWGENATTEVVVVDDGGSDNQDVGNDFDRQQEKKRRFDCAVNWIRIPKVATTTAYFVLMKPITRIGGFKSTKVHRSVCMLHEGRCLSSSFTNSTDDSMTIDGTTCYPRTKACWEFDEQGRRLVDDNVTNNISSIGTQKVVDDDEDRFDFHPAPTQHVALDLRLFGWVLPEKPLVFSSFREPRKRLLSSFHYGINFGMGDLAKGCKRMSPHHPKPRTKFLVELQQTNPKQYEDRLLHYLQHCSNAVNNTYVQYLDPLTFDINVAMERLEKYVVVGLDNETEVTLQRWLNATIQTCHPSRPRYLAVARELRANIEKNKSTVRNSSMQNTGNGTSSDKPKVQTTFSSRVEELIQEYTSGDEIIYKRAREMYKEQAGWFATEG